jgi:Skp family chaperone for outer membrane proteins
MKLVRVLQLLMLILGLGGLGAVTSVAQTPAAQPPAAAARAVQKGKIALINSAALQSQIGEYRVQIEALNKQFEPRVKEVQGLTEKLTALENTIKSQSGVLPPARLAEMTEQLEQMKRERQRKAEDLQADGDKTSQNALAPLKQKLQKFIQDYTTARGITLIVDLARGIESSTVLWFDQRSDVTLDLANEYNKANPVPGAPAAPTKP